MGNMMENMKKAQEIAKQAEVLNKELAQTAIVGQDPRFHSHRILSLYTSIKHSSASISAAAVK